MPVQYTNVIDEHNTTRNAAGLFDICHMGEIIVEGKDAAKLPQRHKQGILENKQRENGPCCVMQRKWRNS